MKSKRFMILTAVLSLLILTTGVALAAPPFDTYVEKGEVIKNDIVLFDGDLEVAEGALVDGSATLFNGDAVIAGTITGDVVLFNGNLTAESTAIIEGDCVLLNGTLEDQTESGLNCTDVEQFPNFVSSLPNLSSFLDDTSVPRPRFTANHFFGGLAKVVGQTIVMGLLAFGVASLLPDHLTQVESAVRQRPLASGVVGLLTAVAVPSLILLLAITSAILIFVCVGILGIPIVFLLAVGLAAGMVMGWITMGDLVGRWLADRLRWKQRSSPLTAALGTAALTFGVGVLGATRFIVGEGLLTVIIVSIGLGAVALTRFGARPYPLLTESGLVVDSSIAEDPDKITAVLETLPDDETANE